MCCTIWLLKQKVNMMANARFSYEFRIIYRSVSVAVEVPDV